MRASHQGKRLGTLRNNRVGEVFGRLTVLRVAERFPGLETKWVCLCACGEETSVRNSCLTSGHTLSCGCLAAEGTGYRNRTRTYANQKPPGDSARNAILRSYRNSAKDKGLTWALGESLGHLLLSQNCHYCDAPPSRKVSVPNRRATATVGGIDRVDNSRGYEPENVVPCCKLCNIAKNDHPRETFLEWVRRLAQFQGWVPAAT